MGKIFYIMGKSSSGKDPIFKRLRDDDSLQMQTIVPYTTRPVRDGETEGVEYHFVEETDLCEFEENGQLIEQRSYDTFHGVWKYFTVNDGQINLTKYDYIVIGTLDSFLKTREFFGEEKVVPIMIELDDGIRLQRALDREKEQLEPKYQELCRRFLADEEDFSDDKKETAYIQKVFHNDDLDKCLREIRSYIQSFQ